MVFVTRMLELLHVKLENLLHQRESRMIPSPGLQTYHLLHRVTLTFEPLTPDAEVLCLCPVDRQLMPTGIRIGSFLFKILC